MKKTVSVILISVFILLCALPSLMMLFFGPAKATANEILSPEASFVDSSGKFNKSVLNDFSDWFSDRFAFRSELSTFWAGINAKLFGISVENKVILGKNDWLYYRETIDDYSGVRLTEDELRRAAENLLSIQNYCASKNVDFVFTVAPNKNSLYFENMPTIINRSIDASNARRLYDMLDELNVHHADLYSAFTSENEVLYFKTDSHWTSKGAALAADRLLGELGRESSWYSSDFSLQKPHTGDLYEMLYPAGKTTETDWVPSRDFTYICESDPNGGNALNIRTSCENGTGSLLCWRDSFGISLYPYLAESFSKAYFSRASSYNISLIEDGDYDTVIIEIVERNISRLCDMDVPEY